DPYSFEIPLSLGRGSSSAPDETDLAAWIIDPWDVDADGNADGVDYDILYDMVYGS
ncbi:MAG: hypothetical protein JNM07_13785, partial [Phycisphaerae bacterium]|nr:hypothetical protein [Phycisphaerae bacterium]